MATDIFFAVGDEGQPPEAVLVVKLFVISYFGFGLASLSSWFCRGMKTPFEFFTTLYSIPTATTVSFYPIFYKSIGCCCCVMTIPHFSRVCMECTIMIGCTILQFHCVTEYGSIQYSTYPTWLAFDFDFWKSPGNNYASIYEATILSKSNNSISSASLAKYWLEQKPTVTPSTWVTVHVRNSMIKRSMLSALWYESEWSPTWLSFWKKSR